MFHILPNVSRYKRVILRFNHICLQSGHAQTPAGQAGAVRPFVPFCWASRRCGSVGRPIEHFPDLR